MEESLNIRLDLFDGADAGTGGQDGGETPAAAAPDTAPETAQPEQDPNEARRSAYRGLVEGEYKDLYEEDTRRLVQRGERKVKGLEEQLGRYQPILDLLAQRYGVEDGDPDKLAKALEADDAYLEKAAVDAGMSVDQYKRMQQLQRENRELLRREERRKSEDAYNRQMAAWAEGERQTKEIYPSFDLRAEAENPEFLSMLRSGVPMRHAYEVMHMEDIKAGVARMQARATEKQVADGIRAKGARPQENGASAQSAFTVKDDVSKLTPAQRADIARRASRGEIITF